VQVTLPHSRRKIKRVRWFECPSLVTAPHTLFIRSTRYFVTYQMFSCDQLESLQRIVDDAVENIINLSSRRIGIRLPAED